MTTPQLTRALGFVATLVVVLSVVAPSGAVAVPGEVPGTLNVVGADSPRSIAVVDVVSADGPNRSGVHPVEVGSTLVVRGTTNRRPDDNAIDVTVTDGPDADRFGFAVVETWGYDGVWTVRLAVPATITPGTYTLSVRVDDETDVQPFEVVERRPAAIGRATLSDATRTVAGESVPAGAAAVRNVTLPDGGYVEIRRGDALAGRSAYHATGSHAVVVVPVDGVDAESDLRAVAVRGTPDAADDPYRRNRTAVAVAVSLPPVGPTTTPTRTPTASPTPSPITQPPSSTATPAPTTGSGPGFGVLAALLAVVAGLGARVVGQS